MLFGINLVVIKLNLRLIYILFITENNNSSQTSSYVYEIVAYLQVLNKKEKNTLYMIKTTNKNIHTNINFTTTSSKKVNNVYIIYKKGTKCFCYSTTFFYKYIFGVSNKKGNFSF